MWTVDTGKSDQTNAWMTAYITESSQVTVSNYLSYNLSC